MRKAITLFALVLLGVTTITANAAEQGLYLGGGVGVYTLDIDATSFDDNATVAKAIAGYRFGDNFAIEVDYQKLFEVEDNILGVKAQLDADAWTVSLRPILPISDVVDLYAKVGYTWYDIEARASILGVSITDDDSDSSFSWGGGVDLNFGNLSLRGEVARIEVDDADLNLITVGVLVRF